MLLVIKLATLNVHGAGLRVVLNIIVLSFCYVVIIGTQGLFDGMRQQIVTAMITDELAGGQYWHKDYDPYDPLSIDNSHAIVPPELDLLIQQNKATPILLRSAGIYPKGRFQTVTLRGIDPKQSILQIPTEKLDVDAIDIPVMIGQRMARTLDLKIGDLFTIQWRDSHGTYDAMDAEVVFVMHTDVATIDQGQIWLPLKKLQVLTQITNAVTMVVLGQGVSSGGQHGNWNFNSIELLLSDVTNMIKLKTMSSSILYAFLLFVGLLAIFDTQVLAIFKRTKEIGTLMALGMTKTKIIAIFTLEGVIQGWLAVLLAGLYGGPILYYATQHGLLISQAQKDFGFAMPDRLFPTYSIALVLGTALFILLVVTFVSVLCARKIASSKPTDALRGKWS